MKRTNCKECNTDFKVWDKIRKGLPAPFNKPVSQVRKEGFCDRFCKTDFNSEYAFKLGYNRRKARGKHG